MKKTIGVAMAAACVASVQMAQAQTTLDTLKVQNLHEVVVKGVRAPKNAPFAVANIKSSELQKFATSGKEMPFLFSRTPGVLAWSENGMGTGAAYMRMRGAGGSRIIDNTQSSERSIPSYSQTDLAFNYTSKVSKALGMKQVTLGIDFNNIFSRHYAASGYVYYDWYNEGKRTSTLAYIPMAGFTCMAHVTLKF